MPERIATAEIDHVETENLIIDDTYIGTYGFFVKLTCNPGPEWASEFETVYDGAVYPGKPPVVFHGDRLCVFYLPRYAPELPRFFNFLRRVIVDTNKAVEKRNSVLPDEEKQKADFLRTLRATASEAFR